MFLQSIFVMSVYFYSLSKIYSAGISSETNGVYLAVVAMRDASIITNEPIHVDDRLLWMTFCNTGTVELSRPLDVAYGIKIELTDASGKEIPKTGLGATFGSKFDRLKSITDTRVYPVLAWGSYKENPSCGGGKFLPTPKQLFQIEKPGIYTLELEMQMFRYVPSRDPTERSKTLFSFPPIKIKVENPQKKT